MIKEALAKNLFKECKIKISDHAFLRWNERVCKVNDKQQIIDYIVAASNNRSGIIQARNDFYYLNDDVVCQFDYYNNIIELITTYGKRSNNPCLNNLKTFIREVNKYGKCNLSLES